MQDWNYVHTNCFEITLELGCVKYPMHQDLRSYWDANKVSLILYIKEVSCSLNDSAALRGVAISCVV